MSKKLLLITPPFTQLNTPYPATPYLKGFLKARGYQAFQADLGIELINRIFSREGLQKLFAVVQDSRANISPNSGRIINNAAWYLQTVDAVMRYAQNRDATPARRIASDGFLPRASRFDQMPDLEWLFGSSGVNDKARFLATLYIEDIGDLIKDAITPYFGFSRYAERLGLSAHSFSPLDHALRQPDNIIEAWLLDLLRSRIEQQRPDIVGMTLPFPGNVYAGLKCGKFIKKTFPLIRVVMGGGFVNTELRELSDPAVFDHVDFVTLDDGELPLLHIIEFIEGKIPAEKLVRTFMRVDNNVKLMGDAPGPHFAHAEAACPDYSDLQPDRYLSLIEIANPMHRLWSDGFWNKLTLAHGCYWHKCSFCDTTLDYIKRYDSAPASVLVDWIERVMDQTGRSGFHFVDEAAPPALLKDLALELLRRNISISWWANIRFEQAFTRDLCRLLAASGCIAVSGGLETASDRLLNLMNKGVTIRQAALACANFSEAGIMVHAYLMYGFPTQTAQETIDSLEVVRQFFHYGLIQSAYWHQFTATVHSDVGKNPEKYQCRIVDLPSGGFARNDLVHEDPIGCEHQAFAQGLNKAVYNFMYGIGTEFPIKEWFGFRVPAVSVKRDHVERIIHERPASDAKQSGARILWLENQPQYQREDLMKKGKQTGKAKLVFDTKTEHFEIITNADLGAWLHGLFRRFSIRNEDLMTLEDLKRDYEKKFSTPFESLLKSVEWRTLREKGLLLINLRDDIEGGFAERFFP